MRRSQFPPRLLQAGATSTFLSQVRRSDSSLDLSAGHIGGMAIDWSPGVVEGLSREGREEEVAEQVATTTCASEDESVVKATIN